MEYNCSNCRRQICVRAGKPCKIIEKILHDVGIKSINWIRPEVSKEMRADGKGRSREVNFSSMPVEWLKNMGIIDTY